MGRKKKRKESKKKHKQKTLTEIFTQSKKREEKEDRIAHDRGMIEKSEDIEEESEIIMKKIRFDFSDSEVHSKDEIEEIEKVMKKIGGAKRGN